MIFPLTTSIGSEEDALRHSFARLSAVEVIDICNKCLAHIAETRKRRDKRYVRKWQLRHNRRWGWWACVSFTEAKAIILQQAKTGGIGQAISHINYPSVYGEKTQNIAEGVLFLAQCSIDGSIYISRDDLVAIFRRY